MDKKQSALNALVYALRCTGAGDGVIEISLSPDERTATITFVGGARKFVNVDGDSAIAAIVDVCRALM